MSGELFAKANGIELCYETFGDPADPALLMIMGLGSQMINWEVELCEQLAQRGFYAIRFDNRDCGRSSQITGPPIDLRSILAGGMPTAAYTLSDMADDAAGLLDALGIEAAHVVGASMGGMIGQTLTIAHPERVLSLCSIMSTTGDRTVGQPNPEALWVLSDTRPATRDGVADQVVRIWRVIGSPGYPLDEDGLRERGRRSFDRGVSPAGFIRQVAAIAASGDRTSALRSISVPTLVIHGTADPLVDMSGGEATARAIPGARLLLFDGMGHDLPRALWPEFCDAIAVNAAVAAVDSVE